MYILGINGYHGDSSACIYKDGTLIAATEEERFRRIKHWAGLPTEAIQFCLKEANIDLTEVDHITISRDPMAKAGKKIFHSIKKMVSPSAILSRGANSLKIKSLKSDICKALEVDINDVKAKVQYIEHHRCHLASSFHISPFKESAVMSVDGMGDFSSTMRGVGKGLNIDIIDSVSYPHSLGIFYTTMTQYLGFPYYGDEYKVMGLSPYGEVQDSMVKKIKEKILLFKNNGLFELGEAYFKHFKEGVNMSWEGGSPNVDSIYTQALVEEFGPVRSKKDELEKRHKDLAASVQKVTEDLIFHMAQNLYEKTGMKNLCLSGGCAQNSVANGKILRNTSFEKLYVPPAGHDAGTASGSALYYYHHVLGKPRLPFTLQPYTGYKSSNEEIESYLKSQNVEYTRYEDDVLFDVVSDAIMKGKVIGWFQGRAEFGPRALGNRSILMDPRRNDVKEILNLKIKKRESFRPFAPSILKEYVGDYFVQVDDVPFMEKVYDIKPEKHDEIPAVTHVNGTGRLQTVTSDVNPRYYKLIEAFYKKSGTPVLVNTSFNENEPIVNTPGHALDCFLRTNMDMLVLENCVIQR